MQAALILLFITATTFSSLEAQKSESQYLRDNFDVKEYRIPMCDGAELFTIVNTPKDKSQDYSFLRNIKEH